ncbi:DUF4388 domain-containing protein [Thermodesulfobacteriota bacterium]
MIALQGKIQSIYLSSILQMLCNDKKSGTIRIWRDEHEVKIYLHDGTIVYAVSSLKEHRLGYLLRSNDIISAEDLRKCLDLSQKKKQTLGKTMVEEKHITVEKLKKFMQQKVLHTLYHLFTWPKGNFEFEEKTLSLEGHVIVNLNTLELILEASRRADERSLRKSQLAGAPPEDEDTPPTNQTTIHLLPS